MKNKKLITSVAAAALGAVMCFSACGAGSIKISDAKFADVYGGSYEARAVVKSIDVTTELDGYSVSNSLLTSNTVYASKTEESGAKSYKIINVKTQNVKTFVSTDQVKYGVVAKDQAAFFTNDSGYECYSVYKTNADGFITGFTIYDGADDSEIFTLNVKAEDEYVSYYDVCNNEINRLYYKGVYEIDGTIYYAKNNEVRKAYTRGSDLDDKFNLFCNVCEKFYEGYYYDVGTEYISVYKSDLTLVCTYKVPDGSSLNQFVVLSGGDLLIQYVAQVPDDSKEYTVQLSGQKYAVVTVKYSISDGKTTVLDLPYIIIQWNLRSDKSRTGVFESFNESVKGIICLTEIKDHQVSFREKDVKFVAVNEKNEFSFIPQAVAGQTELAQLVADNLYKVSTYDGDAFYVDGTGKTVNTAVYNKDVLTEKVCENCYKNSGDNTVYNVITQEKYKLDEDANEMIYKKFNRSFITKKTVENEETGLTAEEYYLFVDGSMNGKLVGKKVVSGALDENDTSEIISYINSYVNFYITSVDGKYFRLYNELGEKLIDLNDTDAVSYTLVSDIYYDTIVFRFEKYDSATDKTSYLTYIVK